MGGEAIEEEDVDDPKSSLICSFDSSDDHLRRTGTKWTAVAHIVAGVIGAGVLSLAWSIAQLGWILGPLCILLFATITLISSALLADCYRHPDPEHGPIRNKSFMDAAKLYLGKKDQLIIGVMAQVGLYGGAVAYTVTAASSVNAILKASCHHREGPDALCEYGDSFYILLFGFIQILVSQIPDFHSMRWLSVSAAVMSFSYSFIGIGLGLEKVIENGTIKGSMTGVPGSDLSSKLWAAFTALGDIAFSYPFSLILLEIEDTLKSPPPENKTMKAASVTAVSITTFFYICCGCVGYAAFGDDTPGNLLAGIGFYEHYWLVGFANACIVFHLVGGYQIYAQAVFATAERLFTEKYPNSRLLEKSYSVHFPWLSALRTNLFRLSFRTTYVASATAIAIYFPYFNSVIGVLGAVNFWPLVVYFPVEMYCVQRRIEAWSREWILLRAFSITGLIISVMGTIGSIEELISAKLS
ncbi:probable amino acid permease 7 isoform X3 [Punica granatum]|nr:probable amino acid permease 7 isoform X3 [Punica granatum]